MSRPIYETAETQKNEAEVALAIGQKWNLKVHKLKDRYRFDYAFIHGHEITGFLEVKCRTFDSRKYKSYMISLDKMMDAMMAWNYLRIKTILAVKWTDGISWIRLDEEGPDWFVNLGGRSDRNDPQDIEPVVYIPTMQFKDL